MTIGDATICYNGTLSGGAIKAGIEAITATGINTAAASGGLK